MTEERVRPGPAAREADRGRPAGPGGPDLRPPRQPVHAAAAGRLGRAPRGVGDPRRGRRPARVLAGGVVRPRGAAGRRDRLRRGGGDRRAGRRPSRRTTCWPSRSGGPGVADGLGRVAEAGARQRAVLLGRRGLVAGAPARARRACASSGPSSPTRGTRSGTTSAGWSTPAFAALAASRLEPGGGGGWPPTGRTTPSRCARCSTPSRCWTGAWSSGWAERPVTRFERKGLAVGRDDHRPHLPPPRRPVAC